MAPGLYHSTHAAVATSTSSSTPAPEPARHPRGDERVDTPAGTAPGRLAPQPGKTHPPAMARRPCPIAAT